ncbi:hypothetical protein SAY86_027773 [Trapa natans]|uniref:Uncharacterized protein n=1 Tax=Trapa natans TaxID=22666 RepID=A0AAN7QL71_TRANT|nr:hypothetical protein SAY86_027773 [Trapa natans]
MEIWKLRQTLKRVYSRTQNKSRNELGYTFIITAPGSTMASAIKSGALVSLEDLVPSSPFFADRSSLRVIGKHGLQEYSVQTALAVIVDGRAKLKVNAVHLMDLSLREGSIYQFIGELSIIQPENEVNFICFSSLDLNLYVVA